MLAAASGVRAEVEYTDMQRWAGLLAQSFLAHSNDKAQAHTQLGLFKSLVNDKVRARRLPSGRGPPQRCRPAPSRPGTGGYSRVRVAGGGSVTRQF